MPKEVIMAYARLNRPNQQIYELAKLKEPNEAEIVAIYMYNLKRLLHQFPDLYLGNGDYTFLVKQGNTIDCAIRYIRSNDFKVKARILAAELKRFLNNPKWLSINIYVVFDFLRTAEVKTEYFT